MMMFSGLMSQHSISVSDDGNGSSAPRVRDFGTSMNPMHHTSFSNHEDPQNKAKKKRNPPGNPHPDSEVIELSPRTLMATNRFVCEVCNRGFQRDQNLQLHRRGHNLPWKLKQRSNKEMKKKKVYVCPEMTCVHHQPSRALGDLTGIKKHFFRKHGEKKWKCDMCAKVYAVESDWKVHTKTCGSKGYRCGCGTLFVRRDSFISHQAFCDALAEESARLSVAAASNSILSSPPPNPNAANNNSFLHSLLTPPPPPPSSFFPFSSLHGNYPNTWEPLQLNPHNSPAKDDEPYIPHLTPNSPMTLPPFAHYGINNPMPPPLSATALLQNAASIGAGMGLARSSSMDHLDKQSWAHKNIGADVGSSSMFHTEIQPWAHRNTSDGFTRDFMGLSDHLSRGGEGGSSSVNASEMMPFELNLYERDPFMKHQPVFSFSDPAWENC